MSRARLGLPALAFLAGIEAAVHSVGIAALCLSVVAGFVLRPVPPEVRLSGVAAPSVGLLEPQFEVQAAVSNAESPTSLEVGRL